MTRRPLALLLLALSAPLALAAAGCHRATRAEFQPRSAQREEAVAVAAVQVYEDDVAALQAVGAKVLGAIDAASMSPYSGVGALAKRATQVAAESGGTHVLLTEKGLDEHFAQTPGTVHTRFNEDGSRTTTVNAPQTLRTTTPKARFLVLRVAPDRWSELPAALRPAPRRGVVVAPSSSPGFVYEACADRQGMYLTRYRWRSGTCGEIPEQMANAEAAPAATATAGTAATSCRRTMSFSADACRQTFERTCPDDRTRGDTMTVRGVKTWTKDARGATGTVQILVHTADGTLRCQGTYDVIDELR